MNNDSNLLISILSGASENRRLEFKEGFNWEAPASAKFRDELIKAVIAMTNTPGGGSIVLGIRTDTRKKRIYPDGFPKKDADSFIQNQEHVRTIIHGYCQRPIDIDIKPGNHPKDESKQFVIFQVSEFDKWPTVTVKPSTTKENNGKNTVIENHAIYTRSKLAQWSSIKAGPQEIEDIIEMAVKKYDVHVKRLGYTIKKNGNKELNKWFASHQAQSLNGLHNLDIQTYMEIKSRLIDADIDFKKGELREAARESTISTFGWPIGVFLDNSDELRPKVDDDGIMAEIPIIRNELDGSRTYDYWAINTKGAFYSLKSIFEDLRDVKIISFNTRIVRITEVFMYLRNLYNNLNIKPNEGFEVTIKHGGIKGRRLGTLSHDRFMFGTSTTNQSEISTTIVTCMNEFIENPSKVVERITEPLFESFEFYKVERSILEQIVNDYINGKVT